MEQQEQTNIERTEEQIVTFVDDGNRATNEDLVATVEPTIVESARDSLAHTVRDILERPIEVTNFTWSLASAAGQELTGRVALPSDWLEIPMVREKLAGFTYLRSGFKVKVQVNAQPFHAGRLLILFDPLYQQQVFTPSNLQHFGGATGYRRIDLDLSESTSAEIVVPYLSNISHFDLVRGIGCIGAVRVYVYSPLTGTSDVEGTVWVEATDVDIQMPTGIGIIPRLRATAQYNGTAKINPAKETAKESRGVVEQLTNRVKGVASALSSVPVISGVASTVGAVADAVGGIASLFGWSKPLILDMDAPVALTFASTMTNTRGNANTKVLALERKNEISIPTGVFGDDSDEMVLSHVLARPTFADRFTFDVTAVPSQILWGWPVSPLACQKLVNPNPALQRVKLNTMLSYVSEMFELWRGGMVFHFKIVKTRFHSARIRVLFVPDALETTDVGFVDPNKSYSRVFDIRDMTEFDFEVPFVSNMPWFSLSHAQGFDGLVSESIPTGMIYVEVVNSLRAPTTAATHIEFLVEVSAAPDFQLSFPQTLQSEDKPIPTMSTASLLTVQTTRESVKHGVFPKIREDKVKIKQKRKIDQSMGAEVVNVIDTSLKVSDVEEVVNIEPAVSVYPEFGTKEWRALVCKLPYAQGPEPVVLFPGKQPTHLYTLYDLQIMWKDFTEQHPDYDHTKYWPMFLEQYPEEPAQCQSNFVKREDSNRLDVNGATMGETVVSFRQLLKRFQYIGRTNSSPGFGTQVNSLMTGSGFQDWSATTLNAWSTAFDRIGALYRWQSGSARVALTRPTGANSSNDNVAVACVPGFNEFVTPTASDSRLVVTIPVSQGTFQPIVKSFPDTEKWIEFQVPHYQQYPAIPTQLGGIEREDIFTGAYQIDYVPANHGTTLLCSFAGDMEFWQATGEDFSFGHLVGPPVSGKTV